MEYVDWLKTLKERYLNNQLKAVITVNQSLVEFYYSIGHDISESSSENTYGSAFFAKLSQDLKKEIPNSKGFSVTNLKYTRYFYELYSQYFQNRQQPVDDFSKAHLFMIPWGHHIQIINKCRKNTPKAIFYVKQTIEHNWSRAVLLNFLDSGLYEKKGKAVTNFKQILPVPQSDLAQELTKDPYSFDFLTIQERYNEKELEDALVSNITKFLLELGSGFSFMGRQYRINVGDDEFFIDLLFYNTQIHAYAVVELKTVKFEPSRLGQLGFYVSAVNHALKTETDNPTIGLLICKDKNNLTAQYALESVNQPIGISEYELSKIYPTDFKGSMPSIEEIEIELQK
ncbi:MAG: PDDEXK nuclease domain-containing protein [Clostridiales bacterium]|nr:PDDEXK nuclease domain-containing protein [Clostridiales bacterium]